MSLSLLDGPISALEKAIPSLSIGEIELLIDAERNGKTRKGAIAALEAALAEAELAGHVEVENIGPGTDITLHDGSHLLFGETALVPAGLARMMRERGQVK